MQEHLNDKISKRTIITIILILIAILSIFVIAKWAKVPGFLAYLFRSYMHKNTHNLTIVSVLSCCADLAAYFYAYRAKEAGSFAPGSFARPRTFARPHELNEQKDSI